MSKIHFNYDSNHTFYRFYKVHDEFEEMSLDSKYNRMKEVNKFLISFKAVRKQKNRSATQRGANDEKCRRALQKVLQCLQK